MVVMSKKRSDRLIRHENKSCPARFSGPAASQDDESGEESPEEDVAAGAAAVGAAASAETPSAAPVGAEGAASAGAEGPAAASSGEMEGSAAFDAEEAFPEEMVAAPSAMAPSAAVASTSAGASTSAMSSASKGGPAPKRRHSSAPANRSMDNFVVRLSSGEMEAMKRAWADFIYANHLSFNVVDDEFFRRALEVSRPGLAEKCAGTALLNRKQLSGRLLDEAEARCDAKLKDLLAGQYGTLSQDGWSSIHREAVIASSITVKGVTYPLDFEVLQVFFY